MTRCLFLRYVLAPRRRRCPRRAAAGQTGRRGGCGSAGSVLAALGMMVDHDELTRATSAFSSCYFFWSSPPRPAPSRPSCPLPIFPTPSPARTRRGREPNRRHACSQCFRIQQLRTNLPCSLPTHLPNTTRHGCRRFRKTVRTIYFAVQRRAGAPQILTTCALAERRAKLLPETVKSRWPSAPLCCSTMPPSSSA